MRFLLNKDSLKELPFKNNILRSTIHPGEWLVKWKDDRGYILVYKKKEKKLKLVYYLFTVEALIKINLEIKTMKQWDII